jgi:hypothetical protein
VSDEQTQGADTADVVGLELAKIMADAPEPSDDADQGDDEESGKGRRSTAAVLIEMAEERYVFGVNTEDEAYALPKEGGHVASLMRGNRGVRLDLGRAYYDKHGRPASQQALADALQVLDAKAHDMPKTALHLRAANHNDATYVDMGDVAQRAIEISGAGWEVVERGVPVLFRRTRLTAEFPEPERGGSLDLLWGQLNISVEDRPLVAAFMVACLICPDVPTPVLVLLSEQGTAKSSTTRCLVRLTDPSHAEFRKPPKDQDQWVTAANGSRVVALDNLSAIPPWLSDSLCRAVTGDADIRRALYTDNDVSVIAFRRAVIVNGIDVGALAGDLAERALPVRLEPIPRRRKLTESELNRRWDQSYPLVLGALFDLAAQVRKVLPGTKVAKPPRMADFAHVLAAVDQVMGTEGLAEYIRRSGNLAAETLEANSFLSAMRLQISRPFTGTMAELLGHVVAPERVPRDWPAHARALLGLMTRNAHALKSEGWTIQQTGQDRHNKTIR